MTSKHILTVALAATVAIAPVTRAAADAGDLIGGLIVGTIIGNAAAQNKQRTTTQTRTVYKNTGSSVQRAANRETQTALNYFTFPAGTADGVMGRKSRAAISSYQAFMSMPVTGELTQFQRDILVGAYNRGVSGSFETIKLVNSDPMGSRALLLAQRDLLTGTQTATRRTGYAGMPIEVSDAVDEIADSSDPSAEQLLQRSGFIQLADLNQDGKNDYILDTSFSGSSYWCSAVQCKTIVFVSTAAGYARNDLLAFDPEPASFNCVGSSCVLAQEQGTVMASTPAPTVQPPADTGTTMASGTAPKTLPLPLFGAPATQASLSSHCSKVSLMTNANGGFTNVSSMTDPKLVLNEQFCLARAFAMDTGEQMVSGMQGVTQAQVDAQCGQYGPVLSEYVKSLALKPRDEVIRDVGGFVLQSGMDATQLASTARICLGTGYRKDDMDVALGSALLLVVLGEAPYAELMGHHLSQGFGATARPDLAMEWYQSGLDALFAGSVPVFAPNQADRVDLIDAAVYQLGNGDRAQAEPTDATAKAALPVFNVTE